MKAAGMVFRPLLSFRDPAIERGYQLYRWKSLKTTDRWTLCVCVFFVIPMIAGLQTDLRKVGPVAVLGMYMNGRRFARPYNPHPRTRLLGVPPQLWFTVLVELSSVQVVASPATVLLSTRV